MGREGWEWAKCDQTDARIRIPKIPPPCTKAISFELFFQRFRYRSTLFSVEMQTNAKTPHTVCSFTLYSSGVTKCPLALSSHRHNYSIYSKHSSETKKKNTFASNILVLYSQICGLLNKLYGRVFTFQPQFMRAESIVMGVKVFETLKTWISIRFQVCNKP